MLRVFLDGLAEAAARAAPDQAARSKPIRDLDAAEVVVQVLPGHDEEQQEFSCDREIVRRQGSWQLRPLVRTT
mgnify:CR=1 FL=1